MIGFSCKKQRWSFFIQQAVLCGKGIVGGVQALRCCLDIFVRVVVQLLVDQVVDDLPQFHHTGDTPLGVVGKFHLCHHGIFPVEHLAVHHGVGEVFYIRVSRENVLLIFGIQSPSLAEMVDKGLEQVEQKNKVGQKLHKKHFLSLMGR